MKKVVAIGGGTGLYTLLSGLKQFPVEITAVVSTMDDGGSAGRLRDEFGVLPSGDIRRCIVALSEETPIMKELFGYRFQRGKGLSGHTFGNLFLTALREILGNDAEAIQTAAKILKIRGTVLPVTLTPTELVATLQNGYIVRGQSNITLSRHNPDYAIVKLELSRPAATTADVKRALARADLIVIGPGDLFTSVLPGLIIRGVRDAIEKSRAKKVYVLNLMTKRGETTGFSVKEHVMWITKTLGKGVLDVAIYNTRKPPERLAIAYRREGSEPVMLRPGEREWFEQEQIKLIGAPLHQLPTLVRHHPSRLARYILNI